MVRKPGQFRLQFPGAFPSLGLGWFAAERAIEFFANRILAAREAVHHPADFAPKRFQKRVDDCTRMLCGEMILFRRAKIGRAGGFGRIPALAVIRPPRMHHD